MARILITGASGNLAQSLAMYLSNLGQECFGLSRSNSYNFHSAYTGVIINCGSATDVCSTINQIKPDIVINTVAETNLVTCENNPYVAYEANVRYPQKLVEGVLNSELKDDIFLVHISTDNVYSLPGFSKENQTRCVNNYGFSKLIGEFAFKECDSLILRTNFLNFGISTETYCDWVINSVTSKAPIELFDNIKFNATTPCNIADNILLSWRENIRGTINLGSHGYWTKASFFKEMYSALNLELPVHQIKNCPQTLVCRPRDMRMNLDLALDSGMKIISKASVIAELSQNM